MNAEFWMEALKVGGPVFVILVIMGRIIYMQQTAYNKFVEKMQKQTEAHNSKVIEFVSNISAAAQSDTDAVKVLSDTVADLNKECRERFGKGSDTSG